MSKSLCCSVLVALLTVSCSPEKNQDWPAYLGGIDSSQYSSLSQVNRDNVATLEQSWIYRTGEFGELQCNSLVLDGLLYCTTATSKAFALNAATGEEIWTFDPATWPTPPNGRTSNRGMMYWADADDRRIYYAAGNLLFALDAKSGKAIEEFGSDGAIDLKQGLGREVDDLFVVANTPGVIFEDLLILGSRVGESNPAAPGHIRAFDVHTGEQKWIFHTIPHPGEFGYETWPEDAWTRAGGANSWAGMSLDKEREMVFVPTGSATYDFYGADRIGDNLFSSALLALNVRTGKRIWHYQLTRHDIWDRDVPAPPNLLTLVHNGKKVDAVAQITKSSHVFIFDRATGEPLFPIEDVQFPASDIPGEVAAPTQPIPSKPPVFSREIFSEDQVTNRTPEATAHVLERLKTYRRDGIYIPGSRQGTVILPGYNGGGEWGGAAVNPDTGIMYVNASEMPWVLTMMEVNTGDAANPANLGQRLYALNCVMCHGVDGVGDPQAGFPTVNDIQNRLSREEVRAVINGGRGRMPGFGHLEGKPVDALVAYLFAGGPSVDTDDPIVSEDDSVTYQSTGYIRFVDQDGYPAMKTPWGVLNAIDLNKGEILWQVALGNEPGLSDYDFAEGKPTGTENYGGPVATAGGLVFIAATKDAKIRAFDSSNGEQLWEADLPAAAFATPSVYMVDGKQYIVVAAGGKKLGTAAGDAYVAFSLPE